MDTTTNCRHIHSPICTIMNLQVYLDRVKRMWYLSPMRAAKVQASLRIRAVSPEPSLLAHTSSESRGTFRQKIRSLAPLNSWACASEICYDGLLEGANSLDGAHLVLDDDCTNQFSPQQAARMHCYLDLVYQPMRQMKTQVPVPISPKVTLSFF